MRGHTKDIFFYFDMIRLVPAAVSFYYGAFRIIISNELYITSSFLRKTIIHGC